MGWHILRTVRGDTWRPSFSSSSLAIHSCPQVGLSRAIWRISACRDVVQRHEDGIIADHNPRCSPLCTRWALKWGGDAQLLGQYLRATNYDKLSDMLYLLLHRARNS